MDSTSYIICSLLSFIPAIVFHEFMHGYAAYKLGDPTAKKAGRLSLNPIKHIDPFGTVVMPLLLMVSGMAVFGYAKPVPYNPSYFKDRRKGDLIVGFAGPAANLILACLGAAVFTFSVHMLPIEELLHNDAFYFFLTKFLPMFSLINLYLMFFNLLPIPPLDGSSIFAYILPEKFLPKYYRVQQYSFPILLILIILMPYVLGVNVLGLYLEVTAGTLFDFLFSF